MWAYDFKRLPSSHFPSPLSAQQGFCSTFQPVHLQTPPLIIYPQKLLVQPYKQLLKQASLLDPHEFRLSAPLL